MQTIISILKVGQVLIVHSIQIKGQNTHYFLQKIQYFQIKTLINAYRFNITGYLKVKLNIRHET